MDDPIERKGWSIPEHCKRHGFSVAFFYKLLKQGKAARVTKLGKRSIITDEAETEWRRSLAGPIIP
jgi:predicted DNA-binding transcriptional regulator AlpA